MISIATANKIVEKFNVSLDWPYGRSNYVNDVDTTLEIIYGLSKLFKIKKDKHIMEKT